MKPSERAELRADLADAHRRFVGAQVQLQRDVTEARRRGLTWTEVGDALGLSKQTAYNRFRIAGTAVSLEDRPLA